ncbi:MAG: hypothetical protein M0Z42_17150 [Actinomycetota bacterium]|nr:hypothetical protein [Actinomycetota bacterium]
MHGEPEAVVWVYQLVYPSVPDPEMARQVLPEQLVAVKTILGRAARLVDADVPTWKAAATRSGASAPDRRAQRTGRRCNAQPPMQMGTRYADHA